MDRLRPGGTVFPWVPTTSVIGRTIPSNNRYYITTFGGGSDRQCIACGDASSPVIREAPRSTQADVDRERQRPNSTYCHDVGKPVADGTWWYLAGAGRWPCGTRLRISDPATGRSCVAVVADAGPGSRIERLANGAIIDASPLVLEYLFNRRSFGYSDHKEVEAVVVDRSTPVGPAGNVEPGKSSSETDATFALALALIGLGVGSYLYLEHARKHPAGPRMNPAGFLVRTISYTPQYRDVGHKHLGSVWLSDRKTADAFAADLSARNHGRVSVERGEAGETVAVFDDER